MSRNAGWDAEYLQIENGNYEGWLNYNVTPEFRLTHQFSNRGTVANGLAPDNHFAILIPRQYRKQFVFQGRQASNNDLFFMCPDSESTMSVPGEYQMITFSFLWPRMVQAFEQLTHQNMARFVEHSGAVSIPESVRGELEHLSLHIINLLNQSIAPASLKLMVKEAEELFLSTLCGGLTTSSQRQPGQLTRRNHLQHLARARDFVEANLDSHLGVEALSAQVGISSRALSYIFRETLSTTPLNYIKKRRLTAARQRLLTAEKETTTVTSVAHAFGFTHLGYFARDYKALFDESPSATLKNN